MSDSKITKDEALNLFPKLEYTKDGKIKDFSVPDSHTLYVKVRMINTNQLIKNEAITLPSIDSLEALYFMVDKFDGFNYGEKWCLDANILGALRSHGEAFLIDPPFRCEYYLRKTKHSDNLKHKG